MKTVKYVDVREMWDDKLKFKTSNET